MTSTSRILSVVLILFNFSSIFPQEIKDLIPPINLTAGKSDTILIKDLFFAERYDLTFHQSSAAEVNYQPDKGILIITPHQDAEGLSLLQFSNARTEYVIPLKIKITQKHTFIYKTAEKPQKVNLFGSFNGWNRDNLSMIDPDKNGTYEITISLEPGRYQYKFFVDGNEIIDPLNSEQIPNGLGGFNSVLLIPERHKGTSYLHLLNSEKTDSALTFSFYYKGINRSSLQREDIIALSDNSIISPDGISLAGNYFKVTVPPQRGENVLRAAVNKDGLTTNLQTIILFDGIPAGNTTPRTLYDNVIYALMIDRFADGDSSNSIPVIHPELSEKANYMGGDFQGIIDKIYTGYFDSLGINTLWISPVVDNTDKAYQEYPAPHRWYTGYHGYWPVHPTGVEEHFGDMELLKKLVYWAHQHNINILLDYVAHHVHEEHPFWKEHRDWFGKLELPDGRLNLRLWDEQRLTTWFEPYMPSFDFEGSSEATNVMTDNAIWWLKETGADGFRHDAVKHIPNIFWRTLTEKINREIEIPQNREVYQIGETFGSYPLVSSYVNNGQLDAQFNFLLYDTAIPTFIEDGASFETLDREVQKTFEVYGTNHLMGNIMDSHDKVRFMAYADNDVPLNTDNAIEIGFNNPPSADNPLSYEKLKLYIAYLISIPGIPVIYYGDEIGMTGAADPDNRRMMRFDNLTSLESKTLSDVRKIVSLRKEHPALRYGDFYPVHVSKDTWAFIRSDLNERILVVLNKGSKSEDLELLLPSPYEIQGYKDLLTGEKGEVVKNKISVQVPAANYRLFQLTYKK